jgi:hypothetical protein
MVCDICSGAIKKSYPDCGSSPHWVHVDTGSKYCYRKGSGPYGKFLHAVATPLKKSTTIKKIYD